MASFGMPAGGRAGRPALLGLLLLTLVALERGQGALAPAHGGAPFDLSVGVCFAALLLGGPRLLPVVVAGLAGGAVLRSGAALVPALGGVAVVAATWAGAAMALRRWGGVRLAAQRDLVWLIVVSAIAAAIGTVGQWGIEAGAYGRVAAAGPALARGWIGDMIGVMVVVPLVLANLTWPERPGRPVLIEILAQGLVAGGVLWAQFWLPAAAQLQLYDLLVLPAIWVAARFGVRGATMITVVVQIGIFAAFATREIEADDLMLYQVRMLVLTVSTLVLGVAVAERRRAEDDLRQRQEELARCSRLTLAGEMAAALAHELNQPLAAALTYARTARRLLDRPQGESGRLRAALEGAATQAERAGQIIRTVREFIGRGTLARQMQPLSRVIRESVDLVVPDALRAGIRLETMIDRGLPSVAVDAVQIQLVLVNLLRNAIEAIDTVRGGRRVVSVSARPDGGGGAEIEVADCGPGLDEAAAARLFQPFSTTKAEGMGLGLVIGRTIIEAHGGRLWLADNGPGGCRFRFTLPVDPPRTGDKE